jgi:hypothetical protein
MVNSISAGVSSSSGFLGLSARPWQAAKYSAARETLYSAAIWRGAGGGLARSAASCA